LLADELKYLKEIFARFESGFPCLIVAVVVADTLQRVLLEHPRK